jgi:multidrug efflux pump subunit AcrB
MAVAVIGGVMVSTVLTLFVVPCFYSLMPGSRYVSDLD